jgi:GDPmannose 4,6-dehydratase
MKAIIFGASGQDGFYLKLLLSKKRIEVFCVNRTGDFSQTSISDFSQVSFLIKNTKPDFIFHFAANSTTKHDALFENHQTIATGTINILEAVKLFSPNSKVFISGSGLQFVNKGYPICETDPFEANDAYSISRIQSVFAARYFRSLGLKVYVGYFFNHDSPLRTERHVTKKISETVKRIATGSLELLKIGNMDVVKEWSFAGDIVEGVFLLVNQDEIFEANIGSGEGYSIGEWVKECFIIIGKDSNKYVMEDTNFKTTYKKLVSNNNVIQSLGYKPLISFKALAEIMMQ